MRSQLTLFDHDPAPRPDDADAVALARAHEDARPVADALPAGVHLGTSSWSFPGWRGLVYSGNRSPTALAREGLREYARHPLLTTVGIDRSYYAPIPLADLQAYAEQLPPGFRCCLKAPAAVTALALGPPGQQAPNPDFLNVERLTTDLLAPCAAAFLDHTGPIILEFPPFPKHQRLSPADFLGRLETFLAALPREFEYAVELRDSRLLVPAYHDILARHGVGHTFNYWSAMPGPADQMAVVAPDTGAVTIIRLLLKPGTWYADQRERFTPFNRIVAPDEAMRADVVAVTRRALGPRRRVYILVNNKAEGSSPLTVGVLARRLAEMRVSADRPSEPT